MNEIIGKYEKILAILKITNIVDYFSRDRNEEDSQ